MALASRVLPDPGGPNKSSPDLLFNESKSYL
jgi:hypothetical protein